MLQEIKFLHYLKVPDFFVAVFGISPCVSTLILIPALYERPTVGLGMLLSLWVV